MQLAEFQFHDTSDYPIVRLSGRGLPRGYGPPLTDELSALLAHGKPFVLVFLSTAENPDHADQKVLSQWIKKNKKRLALLCRGIISIEPNRATRVLKRAQGAVMAAAFGLRLKFAANLDEAEALAKRLMNGEDPPEPDDE